MTPAPTEVAAPGSEAAGTGKPGVEGIAAGALASAAGAQTSASPPKEPAPAPVTPAPPGDSRMEIPDPRPQAVEPQPRIPDAEGPENRSPRPALQTTRPEPPGSNVMQAEPEAKPRKPRHLASAGWVSVPNSGKVLIDDATAGNAQSDGAGTGLAGLAPRHATSAAMPPRI